jgi:hypothetical protein
VGLRKTPGLPGCHEEPDAGLRVDVRVQHPIVQHSAAPDSRNTRAPAAVRLYSQTASADDLELVKERRGAFIAYVKDALRR